MAPYSEQPLDYPSGIRLLVIEPGDAEAEIRCRLRPERLDSNPKYEALSYVWGDPTNLRNISLHGEAHGVTVNLECALRHLRCPAEERVLWVDALCINQEDLAEREAQVKIMGSIYRQAESVLSWLGEAGGHSDEAISLIREFGTRARAYLHNEFGEGLRQLRETLHWHDFFNLTGFPMERQNWIALWTLFNRPYWSRVWIVQELVGAGMHRESRGRMICGTASVEKSLFDYTCTMIVMMTSLSNSSRPPGPIIDEPRRTFELMGHPQAFIMWETTVACAFGPKFGGGLDGLVKATKRLKATDSRDMIYALLPLAPEKYKGFPTNYSSPLRDVLINFVKFMLEVDRNLDILSGNRFLLQRTEPSWTPELFQAEHGWVTGGLHVCAAAHTKPMIHFDDATETLLARGLLVGRVNRVIGPEILPENGIDPRPSAERQSPTPYAEEISAFGRSLTTPTAQETFWRTLVLDHDFRDLKPKYPAPVEFGAMARALLFGEGPPEEATVGAEFESLANFTFPFMKSWERVKWNRCFFTTEEGHMGVGPFHLRSGDVVVMLYGGEYLFILRESGPRYQLIGDAYVHGFMHGELVRDIGVATSQVFTLC